jgi:hypothetical protein
MDIVFHSLFVLLICVLNVSFYHIKRKNQEKLETPPSFQLPAQHGSGRFGLIPSPQQIIFCEQSFSLRISSKTPCHWQTNFFIFRRIFLGLQLGIDYPKMMLNKVIRLEPHRLGSLALPAQEKTP